MTVLYDADWSKKTARRCGGCTLCCRLLPVHHGAHNEHGVDFPGSWHKAAGERCRHQRTGKGCAVYRKPGFPACCAVWNCRWLVHAEGTEKMSRPDRTHYCIDIMPDFITMTDNSTGEVTNIEVVQVWVDPNYPDAHKDPALRDYVLRCGEKGIAAIIRYGSSNAFVLFPPNMCADGQWHEQRGTSVPEPTPAELFEGVSRARASKQVIE